MTRRPLITEREVERARRAGASTLDVTGAVVTPSARDAAARAGIALSARDTGGAGGGGATRPPNAAPAPAPAPAAPSSGGDPARAIVVGADHGGVALKETVAARLRELGYPVTDVGTHGAEAVDYPDFAVAVAREVAEGRARLGIMVDGAGIGSCMAANKVGGVRAAMCHDVTTAVNAREHNDANVLTLGGGLIGPRLALAIVETFLATPFGGGRHARRVEKIAALDRGR